MNRLFLIIGIVLLQACGQKAYFGALDYLGRFPSQLSEVSGIDIDAKGQLWVIEDNGNKDRLYQIDTTATLIRELKIENAKNDDWEDISIAKDGTVFIGDFGNNFNQRKNLAIYRIPPNQLDKKTPKAQKIKFYYPEQKEFPPKKSKLLFDAEGFFHWNGHLYIFTKNRSRPYSGKTLIYRVPDTRGEYEAEFLGEITLCINKDHCSVTGADISDDGKTIALIGYGFIYLLKNVDFSNLSNSKITSVELSYETQIESVCFFDKKTLIIADEQSKSKGRNLYRYSIY